MTQPIVYYMVNAKKLTYSEFENLTNKPSLPKVQNFGVLKNFVAENTNLTEIIVDTDKNCVYLK